jgi:uncharacterized membrane protein YphA (DoxX/SURF4 family)
MELELFGYARGFADTIRWPFVRRAAAPVWLLVRLYLAFVWISFGVGKLLDGWLTENPMGDMLAMIADPEISPAPFAFYHHVADGLLWVGADQVMSVTFPLIELGIALALISGVLLVPAAAMAIFLNTNLILSGVADVWFDMRIITLQLALLLAWRVAGEAGVIPIVKRVVAAAQPARVPTRERRPAPAMARLSERRFSVE